MLKHNSMGASQSSSSQLESQLAGVPGEIKPKKLRQLHQQVLFEYPFLANIFESMLITDCRLPDCPIVYCNDLFEQMTCYPKEEIIGKNCRFLQGVDTDKNVVRSIRKAVDEGLELEVELLNYRKDGVPFYNVFLMLPIHAPKKNSGTVQYFIAIQKDITILRQPGSNPQAWTPAEVGMWLYHSGLSSFMQPFMDNGVTGEQLLKLKSYDEISGIADESTIADQKVLLTKVTQLANNPAKSYQVDISKINQFQYTNNPENAENSNRLQLGDKVDVANSRSWWRSIVPKKQNENMEEKYIPIGVISDPYSDLRDICTGTLITMKVFFKKNITVIQIPSTITYNMLMDELLSMTKVPIKCKYKDLDGDWVSLEDDDSVEAAILCKQGGTVSVKLSKRFKPLSKEKQLYLNATPIGIAITDSEGCIIFMNKFAQKLLQVEPHDYMRRKFRDCISKLDTNIVDKEQEITYAEKIYKVTISSEVVEYNNVLTLTAK